MKVQVAKLFPQIQVSHEGVIYKQGDEVDVPENIGTSWARAGWVHMVDGVLPPSKTLSGDDSSADVQAAKGNAASTAEAAGAAPSPRVSGPGSAASK